VGSGITALGSGITSRGIGISSVFNGNRDQALLDPTDNFKYYYFFTGILIFLEYLAK